jgi:hypothetical protein
MSLLSVAMLSDAMLSVAMQSVNMLSDALLIVVAPPDASTNGFFLKSQMDFLLCWSSQQYVHI